MINRRLIYYLEANKSLHPSQSGFRKGRSTIDNLLAIETDVRLAFLQRKHLVAIFFDIEKAYDRTWRKFRVKVESGFSDFFIQEEGVPQESVRAGYIKLTVGPSFPNPLRCFKCQRFGHSKASCRGTLTCARCAEAGHDSSDCKASEKCVNCKGSHTSFSRLCSAWKFEKEVIAEKVKKDISFLEARQIIKSHTPAPGTSYASAVRKKPETTSTRILPTILPSVPFKASYTPSEICSRSIDSVLKLSLTDTPNKTISFQFKVPESNKNPPDFSDFNTVTNRKKLKKDSQVNQDNITVDKVSQYYKPPQLTDKKPCEASNSVIKESNITVTRNGIKSAHVCFVGPVSDSMAPQGHIFRCDGLHDPEVP
ncbi:hypothetical protein AVEN_13780-1 [Araneus ventricosus]|uniref:CCHC-type domain-containing protein n=1 Tax=Araneus ventricosus TaxID=182803 RepID=A0A4Y2HT69_ARAVE|nr:hypothetical protein AVEN_13780-1 [Araneus ventricosus]